MGESAELRGSKDAEALKHLLLLDKRLEGGELGGAEAIKAEQGRIVQEWSAGSEGRSVVVGAVDASTHEFARSGVWMRERGGSGDVYLSDMAVHPSFQKLGIGQVLLEVALRHSKSRGFKEAHLHVEEDNTAAARLYNGGGFEGAAEDACTLDLFEALLFVKPPAPKIVLMTRRL